MNKKIIIPVLSIAALAGVSVATTYALFTSKASSKVVVNAGTVAVSMDSELLSALSRYEDLPPYDAKAAAEETDYDAIFENGGVLTTTTVDNVTTVDIENFAPMDKFSVKLHAVNSSTIDVKYRLKVDVAGALLPGIKIEIDGEDFSCRTEAAVLYSDWSEKIAPSVTELFEKELVVTFEDREDNNDYQGKNATIVYSVEMVQGNASVENPTSAARIGMNQFDTFEEAIAFSRKGDTITVMNDIDLTSYPAVSFNMFDLTEKVLDLNGKTISSKNWGVGYDGYSYTIKNGKFVSVDNRYSLCIGDGACDFELNEGIILEDLVLSGGINIFATNKVVIRNVVSSNDTENLWYSVFGDEGSEITIESGEYTTPSLNGHRLLDNVGADDDASMVVKGGTFIAPEGVGITSSEANLVIEGGSWNLDPSAWVDLEAYDVTLASGMYTVTAK